MSIQPIQHPKPRPVSPPTYVRPEDYDAEEPKLVEEQTQVGRQQAFALQACAPLVKLLDSSLTLIIVDAANALFNLTIAEANADSLLTLGALPKLCVLLFHEDPAVKAAAAGVLMNVCATSSRCRSELAYSGLLRQLLDQIVASTATDAIMGEAEVRKNALGALNNLMLDAHAAKQLRPEGGIEILVDLLRVEGAQGEARLEDAGSSLLRALQEDVKAGEVFVECGGLAALVSALASPNEELQVRLCGLIFQGCEQVPTARQALHELKVVKAVLPLLTSSSEEVQESAARAIEKISRMPAAAIAVRRQEGIPMLIDLMSSSDEGVQLAAVCALMNVAHSDPKAAAAIRDSDGLKPLVTFLTCANVEIQIASANTLLGCSRNEANKTGIRELGGIEQLLKMLPNTNPRDAQAAAVATLAYLTLNEDDARVLVRLQGGLKKLQALLYANDPILQAHAAEVFTHCAPNHECRIAMRLVDCLAPLVALLSSPHAAARTASAGALMQATQATRTNQIKCRELGAIAPLLRLLEPPDEGPPDRECQRKAVWSLSNIACEPTAAKQLRQSPSGFGPLIQLISEGDPILQRPASACLFNASANDLGAPGAIHSTRGFPALSDALVYQEWDHHHEIVAMAAGILHNCAAIRGFATKMMAEQPEIAPRLLGCIRMDTAARGDDVPGYILQTSSSIGALMNLTTEATAAVEFMLSADAPMAKLLEVMPVSRDEWAIECHAAGCLANICMEELGRAKLVQMKGVKTIVETLEASEDDNQSTSCCVALLNACFDKSPPGSQAEGTEVREQLLDCSGVGALVNCLASENVDLKAAAAGALLNCSATAGCAEAIRDATVDNEATKTSASGFELLLRLLSAEQPLLRARAAGALFNCAAFGPDTRLAMLEAGVLTGVAAALKAPNDHYGAPKGTSKELTYRIQSNLVGVVLNAALNPTCKTALLAADVMTPLVEVLGSPDPTVQSQASTAIAYLSDKAEPRPGSPNSTLTSIEDPAAMTKAKLRFHQKPVGSGAAAAAALGSSSGSSSSTDPHNLMSSSVPYPAEDPDDTPGARTKALIGLMPKAKVSATHDSKTKLARSVQERPEVYGRRLTVCYEPSEMEEPYQEIPTPLPSPRDY